MSDSLLTSEIAQSAVEFILPSVRQLAERQVLQRGAFHIVISNPIICEKLTQREWEEKAILLEYAENADAWLVNYRAIARSKCYLSWLHEMPTQMIQARSPFLLGPGDTMYYGSVYQDGLSVACSGLQPYYDEMIAAWVFAACRAKTIEAAEKLRSDGKFDGFVPKQ